MGAAGRVFRVREGKHRIPVEVGDGKGMSTKQKLVGAWPGSSEPEAIVLCLQSLNPHS